MARVSIIQFLLLICTFQKVTSLDFSGLGFEELEEWKTKFKDGPKINLTDKKSEVIERLVKDGADDPEKYFNTAELAENYGYEVETHYIITEDGYNLTAFRLPNDRQNAEKSDKETDVVIIGHGLFSSSDDFATSGKNNSIAFLLADEGYDVWIINYRGNKYSRRHRSLNPDTDGSFWDFSFDEMGRYDLPATIDYVLGHTGQSSVKYVCHAQGCTNFFVMGSVRPEYSDKVTIFVGLSVLSWMSHTISPALQLFAIGEPVFKAIEALGIHEVASDNPLTDTLKEVLCGTRFEASVVCSNLVFPIGGFDYTQIDTSRFNVQLAHVPSGISLKNVEHLGQVVRSGTFRMYDNGILKNHIKYKSKFPPNYDVSKIQTPVAVLWGANDWLARKEDHEILFQHLPNVAEYYKVPYELFNHFDFLWAKDLSTLLFPKMRELLQKY